MLSSLMRTFMSLIKSGKFSVITSSSNSSSPFSPFSLWDSHLHTLVHFKVTEVPLGSVYFPILFFFHSSYLIISTILYSSSPILSSACSYLLLNLTSIFSLQLLYTSVPEILFSSLFTICLIFPFCYTVFFTLSTLSFSSLSIFEDSCFNIFVY